MRPRRPTRSGDKPSVCRQRHRGGDSREIRGGVVGIAGGARGHLRDRGPVQGQASGRGAAHDDTDLRAAAPGQQCAGDSLDDAEGLEAASIRGQRAGGGRERRRERRHGRHDRNGHAIRPLGEHGPLDAVLESVRQDGIDLVGVVARNRVHLRMRGVLDIVGGGTAVGHLVHEAELGRHHRSVGPAQVDPVRVHDGRREVGRRRGQHGRRRGIGPPLRGNPQGARRVPALDR